MAAEHLATYKVEIRYDHVVKSIEEKESDMGDDFSTITFGNGTI